jgi:hypothetical protein
MCKMDNEESGQVLTQISTADCFWVYYILKKRPSLLFLMLQTDSEI